MRALQEIRVILHLFRFLHWADPGTIEIPCRLPDNDIYVRGDQQIGTYLYDLNGNMTSDSRKNLELGYNFLNLISEVKENGAYYGLLGDAVLLSQYNDKNIILEMLQNIDEAIENYYWSAYMNEKQKEMPFPEYYSAGTDMGVSRKVSGRDVLLNKQVRTFPYQGGKVSYEISNLPSNASIDWGDGVMKPATGFTISTDRAVNVLIRELNRNFVSVLWQFPNVQSWNNARRIAETLLKDRIW